MKNRVLAPAIACLLCFLWLFAGVSHAAESRSLREMVFGKVVTPSQPATDNDEPEVPDGEEEEPGFDTPEEAVAAYFAGLKNGNLEEMLSACAIGIYVDRRDVAVLLNYMGVLPPYLYLLPNTNSFLLDANFEIRRADLTKAIVFQYVTLLIPQLDVSDRNTRLDSEEAVDRLIALFGDESKLKELSSLVVLEVTKASEWRGTPENYNNERNVANIERQARAAGADGYENIVVVFRFDGRKYAFFPMIGRYGDKWLIIDLRGNVSQLLDVPIFTGGLMKLD